MGTGGTIKLTADNNYTGVTNVAGGAISLASASSLGSGPVVIGFAAISSTAALTISNALVLDDSFLYFTGANALTFTGPVTLVNPMEGTRPHHDFLTGAGGVTFAGVISGPGGLTLQGNTVATAGNTVNLTLARANTFSGGVVFAGLSAEHRLRQQPHSAAAVVALNGRQ